LSALAKNTFAGEDTCITGILTGKSIECKSSDKFMFRGRPGRPLHLTVTEMAQKAFADSRFVGDGKRDEGRHTSISCGM
jgi:hypothetical protein